jgi:hypothetical protein
MTGFSAINFAGAGVSNLWRLSHVGGSYNRQLPSSRNLIISLFEVAQRAFPQ